MYNFGIQNIVLSREDLKPASINDNCAVEGQGYIGNVMKCHLVLCFCRHRQEVNKGITKLKAKLAMVQLCNFWVFPSGL